MHVRDGADVDTAVGQVLDSLLEISGVRRAGLALTEGGGRRLRFTLGERDSARTAPGEALEWCHIDAYDDVPITTVLRTGKPVVDALELLEERHAAFVESQSGTGIVGVAAFPLKSGDVTWGGFVLFYDTPQRFGPHQVALLELYAERAAHEVGSADNTIPAMPRIPVSDASHGEVVRLDLDPYPGSVAVARRFARGQLARWGIEEETLDAAVLCLSELVTNVVVHAAARSHIELRREPDRLVVTVRDGRGRAVVTTTGPGPDLLVVHGRGLLLVEALSDQWGSISEGSETTVWCEFATGRSGEHVES